MKNARIENWTNLVLGIWFFITPWVFANRLSATVAMTADWNAWIVGAVVALSAALALRKLAPVEEWVNLFLGVWMVLSPWMFGYANDASLAMNSVIVGAVVAVLSGISIPAAQRMQYQK